MKGSVMRFSLSIFMIVLISLSGCASYTVLFHPEVEVYDERLGKYLFEEVTPASNCRSCHQDAANKFDVYSRLLRTHGSSSSLEKIDLIELHAMPELRGYENYLYSDFGSYYYAAWWFNPIIVEYVFHITPSAAPSAASTSERVRQSYRRSSGRMPTSHVSTTGTPATNSRTSPSSAASASTTATPVAGSSTPAQHELRHSSGRDSLHNASQRAVQYSEPKPDSALNTSGRHRE